MNIIIYLKKIKKNGVIRLFKMKISIILAKLRGLIFGFVNTEKFLLKNLNIYSGVKSIVRHLEIGDNVSIGQNCSFGGLGRIILSNRVVLNRNTHLDAESEIRIGENSLIGPDCYFVDSNHVPSVDNTLVSSEVISKNIEIGKNVWLGRGVTVLSGVSIGNNSVIGAGSVVTKNIPSGVVAAGIPARIIKSIKDKDKSTIY
jgi:acetyltransferase-like isoleucine patch superfamily enzyme